MAVKSNPSLEGNFKKFIGITKLHPIGVTAEVTEQYGTRVDFECIIGETKLKTKVQFFLKNEPRKSKDGKTQFIGTTGRCTWAFNPEEAKEALDSKVRVARNGEERLMKFLRAFTSAKKGEECLLDHMVPLITKGDVKELNDVLESTPNNKVRACLGLNPKGYQTVYTGEFGVGWSKDDDYMVKQIEKDTTNKITIGTAPYPFMEVTDDIVPKPNDEVLGNEVATPQVMEIDYSTNTLGDMIPEDFPVAPNDGMIRDENGNILF